MADADVEVTGTRFHWFLSLKNTLGCSPAPVGASLLAKAVRHSTLMSTEPPHSRASSLPQGL
ncbi:hypothetical protein FGA82_11130 [Pseudomonas fluorescens]|nr:hypothetical protein FGA82_11130 [Pseudomonas fluorescens]